jgi:hypothetical protein
MLKIDCVKADGVGRQCERMTAHNVAQSCMNSEENI